MATHQKLTASKRYLYKQVEGGCWEINSIAERESQNHQRLPSKSIYFDQRENIYFCPKIAIGLPDEPIDLSTIHNKKQQEDLTISNSINTLQPLSEIDYSNGKPFGYSPGKYNKRKVIYTEDDDILLVNVDKEHPAQVSFSSDKKLEVLKAAKSLFSKRTRTLYHWMYPNISKQQIKQAVTTSWESLNKQEKDLYISQVLGRFGFSHSNLMVNPQIDSLKVLPPIPPTLEINRKSSQRNKELQMAIKRNSKSTGQSSAVSFEQYEGYTKKFKKRRLRTSGQKRNVDALQFQDDPELSFELEKFALKFNLKKAI